MIADPHHALKRGYKLDGYLIEHVIGSGGFGITYKATDVALSKPVAIKEYVPADIAVRLDDTTIVPKSESDRDDFAWGLERFLDEARTLVRFDHKNIVSVIRFIEAHGTAYIVMDFIDGETLSDLLKREKTLSYTKLTSILNPLLSGLEVVHDRDFLHRDVKPGNIIIRENGTAVLIDFGAARQAIGAKSRSVTAIVTPGYAPIEQYSTRGKQGAWTDIYALGAIAYKAITGETPVDATERVRRDPLVSLINSDVPKQLGYPDHFLRAIDKSLEVDEEARPQNISEWRAMLKGKVEVRSSVSIDDMAKTRVLPKSKVPKRADKANKGRAAANDSASLPSLPTRSAFPMKAILGGVGALVVVGLGTALIKMVGEADTPSISTQAAIDPDLSAAWSQAQSVNSVEAYEGFRATFPDSLYDLEAEKSIEQLNKDADQSSDKAAFEAAKAKGLVSGFGQYVQDYPEGQFHTEADEAAWESAERQNTQQAYEAYLKYFPEGQHAQQVQSALAKQQAAEAQALVDKKKDKTIELEKGRFIWEKTYGGLGLDVIWSIVLTSDGGALLGGYGGGPNSNMYLVRVDGNGNKLWDKTYDGISIASIVLTSDGGALLGGRTASKGAGRSDMYLVRVDSNGNQLWDKTYGGSSIDSINSMVLTSDGGALLGGQTSSKGAGGQDMYLVRVDSNGNQLWDKTFGGSSWDSINSIVLTSDGGALLGGGSTSSKGAGGQDMYLVRVDSNGNELWDKTYGGVSITSIALTSDGGALLGGHVYSSDSGRITMYLVRVDKKGKTLWNKTYDDGNIINTLVLTSDDGAFLGGGTFSKGAGALDMYLLRVDHNGTLLWDKTFGGSDNDNINTLVLTSDGSAFLGGETHSKGAGRRNMYLLKVDNIGP